MASQRKLERKCVASQIPELESGENSRRKLQNVVTDSTVAGQPGDEFTLKIDFVEGRKHLPIVTLQRAA